MIPQDLLDAIIVNFADLQGELSFAEFFFEIGLDGSSFREEIDIARIMRDPNLKRSLRESGIDFIFDRCSGKLRFVEVVTNE